MVACNQHCNIHYLKRLTYVDLEVCVARRDANNHLRLGLRMRTLYHVMLKPLYYKTQVRSRDSEASLTRRLSDACMAHGLKDHLHVGGCL